MTCWARCGQDHFCDIITHTCMHCMNLCTTKVNTPRECKKECPGYQVPSTTTPTESIETLTDGPDSNNGMTTTYVLIFIIFIVCCLCCVLVVFIIARKNRLGRWMVFGHCGGEASVEADTGSGYCCNCCNKLRHSISIISQTPSDNSPAIKQEETALCTPVIITHNPVEEEEKIACIPVINPDSELKFNLKLPSVDAMDTGKQTASSALADTMSTQKPEKAPPKATASARARDEGGKSTKAQGGGRFSSSRASTDDKLSSYLANDSNTNESYRTGYLSLALLSDDQLPPAEQPSVDSPVSSADHWESVMRVYDIVDQRLHEMSWVAGCMISNTALKITVKSEPTPENKRALKQRLRNVVPSDIPSERFALTFEGPALQTMAGPFGSGNMVSATREAGPECRSTVTIFGRCSKGNGCVYRPQTYTFTVGHVAQEGSQCQVKASGEEYGGVTSGKCLAHLDTVNGSYVSDIKHKIYDLALIELEQPCSLVNSRSFLRNGRKVTLRVELNKGHLKPVDLKPGRKVLIFGGPQNRTIEAEVDAKPCYTCAECTPGQSRTTQTVNLIQLSTSKPGEAVFVPGHSGSLVAWSPLPEVSPGADGSVVVQAFAMIVGVNAKAPEKGFAVPLWEQMCQLFRKNAKFSYFHEHLLFDDYIEESGFYTSVYSV